MKKLLTILFAIAFIGAVAQEKPKKEDYSQYKPCAECFENWKVSESNTSETPSVNPGPSGRNSEGRSDKPFRQTYLGSEINGVIKAVVGTVLMLGTVVLLGSMTKVTTQ
jgi:hypothetical protein